MTIKNKRKFIYKNKDNRSLIERMSELQYQDDILQYRHQMELLKLQQGQTTLYDYIKQKEENL